MKYFIHSIAFQTFSASGQSMDFFGDNKIDIMTIKSWEVGNWVNATRTYNSFNADCSVNATQVRYGMLIPG